MSNKAKRSLLADLEAVSDDIDLHFNVDYAFRSSCLIKAISMPRTRRMFDGYAEGFQGNAQQVNACYGPASLPPICVQLCTSAYVC